jgi:hypothetical protein
MVAEPWVTAEDVAKHCRAALVDAIHYEAVKLIVGRVRAVVMV